MNSEARKAVAALNFIRGQLILPRVRMAPVAATTEYNSVVLNKNALVLYMLLLLFKSQNIKPTGMLPYISNINHNLIQHPVTVPLFTGLVHERILLKNTY